MTYPLTKIVQWNQVRRPEGPLYRFTCATSSSRQIFCSNFCHIKMKMKRCIIVSEKNDTTFFQCCIEAVSLSEFSAFQGIPFLCWIFPRRSKPFSQVTHTANITFGFPCHIDLFCEALLNSVLTFLGDKSSFTSESKFRSKLSSLEMFSIIS